VIQTAAFRFINNGITRETADSGINCLPPLHNGRAGYTGSFPCDVWFRYADSLSFAVSFPYYESDGVPFLKSVLLSILASRSYRLLTDILRRDRMYCFASSASRKEK
jgi:hypothetical protein